MNLADVMLGPVHGPEEPLRFDGLVKLPTIHGKPRYVLPERRPVDVLAYREGEEHRWYGGALSMRTPDEIAKVGEVDDVELIVGPGGQLAAMFTAWIAPDWTATDSNAPWLKPVLAREPIPLYPLFDFAGPAHEPTVKKLRGVAVGPWPLKLTSGPDTLLADALSWGIRVDR